MVLSSGYVCLEQIGDEVRVMSQEASQHSRQGERKSSLKPIALILAGYDKLDVETRRRKRREIREAYDGDEIYIGRNKFLNTIAGKPVIQYVLDAVFKARKGGRRVYDRIFVYNDTKSFQERIPVKAYPNLTVEQMKDSVGGHLKDFYFRHVEYGQHVDIFFGDTPRITTGDVEWIHREYKSILGKKRDHRGNTIAMVYGIVEFADLKDNWLEHRIKYIRRGPNKGKLKSFVGFENCQARIGNSGAFIKDRCLDELVDYRAVNFFYNLRKALTPSTFSKILYHLWKTKQFDMIRQVKRKNIKETEFVDAAIEVIGHLLKIDLSTFSGMMYHIKHNAAHWENDIDGPRDLAAFRKKFAEQSASSASN